MTLPLAFLLILLVAAAAWLFPRLHRVAAIGAAYKARVLCSVVFGSGRTVDLATLEDISADSYRLMRLFRCRVDYSSRSVTASLAGFPPRIAVYRGDADVTTPPSAWQTAPASPALERTVASAFLEPDRRRLRRTRAILVVQDGQIVAER